MKAQFLILVVSLLFLAADCGKNKKSNCRQEMVLRNNSNRHMYWEFISDTTFPEGLSYPGAPHNLGKQTIPANSFNSFSFNSGDCIESFFGPPEKRYMFFFDGPTADANWDSVLANYIVAKRVELTLDSMKKLNWTVEYP